jgi:hypothetical protein
LRQQLVPLPPRPRPSWTSLGVSAAVHVVVAVLALTLSARTPVVEEPEADAERQVDQSRQVEMVYLPPPPPEPPPPPAQPPPPPPPPVQPTPPPPRPVAPPPEQAQPEPEDRANAPPDAVRSEGEESDEPEGASDPEAPAEAPRAEAPAAPTLESEARRIFGRRRVATAPGVGPRAVRPLETYLPDRPEECVPTPKPTADSSAPVQYGTVVGRIFREDGGSPLAGAHLQMLGTPYVAFTDSEGEYRFRFDLSLMDNCRTQYVRVSAKGYESRLLVLVVGQNVRSEDVHLERRSRWPGL